jgi:hypothetical protein
MMVTGLGTAFKLRFDLAHAALHLLHLFDQCLVVAPKGHHDALVAVESIVGSVLVFFPLRKFAPDLVQVYGDADVENDSYDVGDYLNHLVVTFCLHLVIQPCVHLRFLHLALNPI